MNIFSSQMEYFVETLKRPEGVVGILGVILILIAHFASKSLKWWILPIILWLTTIAYQINAGEARVVTLAQPLQTIQINARLLCLALVITLVVTLFTCHRDWRPHPVGAGVFALFFYQCVLAARIMMSDTSAHGQLSLVVYVLLFVTFGLAMGRWLQDWVDARRLVRAIALAGVLYIIATAYQLLMNGTVIIRQNRLSGTSGNAQHCATVLALSIPPLCYLIVRKGQRYLYRLLLGAAGGVMVIMLIWTGSRTGMLMSLVGVAVFFRTRIGRLLGVGILTSIFVLAALQIYTESTAGFSEMFMRGDTRSHVWSAMLEEFREHPAMGQMGESFGVGENSYLSVAANAGLVGLVPMTIAMLVAAWQVYRLQRVRKQLKEHTLLADLAVAGLAALAVGAMFEGYLLGTLTFPIMVLYIDLVLIRFLLDAASVSSRETADPVVDWEAEAQREAMVETGGVYAQQT